MEVSCSLMNERVLVNKKALKKFLASVSSFGIFVRIFGCHFRMFYFFGVSSQFILEFRTTITLQSHFSGALLYLLCCFELLQRSLDKEFSCSIKLTAKFRLPSFLLVEVVTFSCWLLLFLCSLDRPDSKLGPHVPRQRCCCCYCFLCCSGFVLCFPIGLNWRKCRVECGDTGDHLHTNCCETHWSHESVVEFG